MGGDFTNTEALVREMYDKVMQVSDLDWSEICTKYNCAMHPDHLRKMGAGIKLAAESERKKRRLRKRCTEDARFAQ